MQLLYNKLMQETNLKRKIADNLRKYRALKRLSQDQLSVKSGISQIQISKIENELVNSKMDTLFKLANALDITVNDLVY